MEQKSKNKESESESVHLKNTNIIHMKTDFLYHLGLGNDTHDLQKMFGDVKFIVMGGTKNRMENFAHFIMKEINYEMPVGAKLDDITAGPNRYSMYKIGPVLSVSHGLGMSSLGVLLHELFKLMFYAKCKDPILIRLGTSGGIGIEGGTVVVSKRAVNGLLSESHDMISLGKIVQRPSKLDASLADEIKSYSNPIEDGFPTVSGATMAADDFYVGQGRLDGAFCDYNESDKLNYLRKLQEFGVVNIEMEAILFAALTYEIGIKSAIICVAYLDRLHGDQTQATHDEMEAWQRRPQKIVARFIKHRLSQ